MPGAIIPLPDVYETIIRKVAVDSISQISTSMNIPSSAKVYLPGRSESVPMNDGLFGNCCDSANAVYFDPEERITVTYEEIADENFSLSTSIYSNDNYPILVNETNNLYVHPITRYVDFRIDIEYQAPSIVLAQRWIDDQRMRYSAGAAELTMSLTYHYNIPKSLMALLQGLYDTVQRSPKPFDGDFKCWLDQYWTGPTTEMATGSGQHPVLSVYERAVDVLGIPDWYNTPETPRPSDDRAGAYVTEFSFICRYARPTHLKVDYPLLMNNCVIPKKFHPELPYSNYQQMNRKTTALRGSLEYAQHQRDKLRNPYIQHPIIDDWQALFDRTFRLEVFVGLIVVCEDNPRQIMSLESLGRYSFNPYWLEAIKVLGDALIAPNSFMEFKLFRNNRETGFKLHIDTESMTLRADRDLDIEGYYHIQLCFNTHLESINFKYWNLIRSFPHFYYDWCRFFGGCPVQFDEMELIGVGRARIEPGEGSTEYSNNLPVIKEGYIRKDEYYNLVEYVDNVDIRPGDIFRIFKLGIITEARD